MNERVKVGNKMHEVFLVHGVAKVIGKGMVMKYYWVIRWPNGRMTSGKKKRTLHAQATNGKSC